MDTESERRERKSGGGNDEETIRAIATLPRR